MVDDPSDVGWTTAQDEAVDGDTEHQSADRLTNLG